MATTRIIKKDEILFTKGNGWWSEVICAVLGEPVSHVSVLRDGVVYHSDLFGVRAELYSEFADRQDNILAVPVERIENLESKYATYKHYNYDLLAMCFLGLSFLARRFLHIPMPKSNLWNISGMYICTEWVSRVLGNVNSMITPWGMYIKLTENK